jgi:hypothetical protein
MKLSEFYFFGTGIGFYGVIVATLGSQAVFHSSVQARTP